MFNYDANSKKTIYNITHGDDSANREYFGENDAAAVQFGIEQIYFDEGNNKITTEVANISEKKELIELLLVRLRQEDVHPCTLQDIVEDFIVEMAEI